MPTMIFHVTALDDWRAAEVSGTYTLSTRGKTLAEVGFIHCSTAAQVVRVANLIYRGVHGLVLLVIDRSRVRAPVRDEPAPIRDEPVPIRDEPVPIRDEPAHRGHAERFPHIYGPLNLDAVVQVLAFEPNADGSFSLPELPLADSKLRGT